MSISNFRVPALAAAVIALLAVAFWFSAHPGAEAQSDGSLQNFTLESDTPGHIDATWDEAVPSPSDYRIRWAVDGQDYPSWKNADGNGYPTGTSYTISGLQEGVRYKVQARARYGLDGGERWSGDWAEQKITVASTPAPTPTPTPTGTPTPEPTPAKDTNVPKVVPPVLIPPEITEEPEPQTAQQQAEDAGDSDILLGNLDRGNYTGRSADETYNKLANAFTSGDDPAGYGITGVEFIIRNEDNVSVSLAIHSSDGSDAVGTVLHQFTTPSLSSEGSERALFTRSTPAVLNTNTKYWLVLSRSGSGAYGIKSLDPTPINGASGWSLGFARKLYVPENGTGSWGDELTWSFALNIRGYPRRPVFEQDSYSLSIDENTRRVEESVTANHGDGDTLVLSISENDTFNINNSGILSLKDGVELDYEAFANDADRTIEVQVTATDMSGDTATVDVVIMVNNVEEEGAFTFDKEFEYGNTVTATLTDSDGAIADAVWTWSIGDNRSRPEDFVVLEGETDGIYTLDDVTEIGKYIVVSVAYHDGFNSTGTKNVITADPILVLHASEPLAPVFPVGIPVGTVLKSLVSNKDDNDQHQEWGWKRQSRLDRTPENSGNDKNAWDALGENSDIDDATSATYTTTDADAGVHIWSFEQHKPSVNSDLIYTVRSTSYPVLGGSSVIGAYTQDSFDDGSCDLKNPAEPMVVSGAPQYVCLLASEDARVGSNVGNPTTAVDPNSGDATAYKIKGTDSPYFSVSSRGQIRLRSGVDYENKNLLKVILVATDSGNRGTEINLLVKVVDVDEGGEATLSARTAYVGETLHAGVTDPDGVTITSYQWASSASRSSGFTDIADSNYASYLPLDADVDKYLKVTMVYTDSHGEKTVNKVSGRVSAAMPLLVGNVGQTAVSDGHRLNSGNWIAQKFRTGPHGYTVGEIALRMHSFVNDQNGGINFHVASAVDHGSGGTRPGGILFTSRMALQEDVSTLNLHYADVFSLDGNTDYYVMLEGRNPAVFALTDGTGLDSGSHSGFSLTDGILVKSGDEWNAATGDSAGKNAMFSLRGKVGKAPGIVEAVVHRGGGRNYDVNTFIEVYYTFSEPVRVSGSPTSAISFVTLGTGNREITEVIRTVYADHVLGNDTDTLLFVYRVQEADKGKKFIAPENALAHNVGLITGTNGVPAKLTSLREPPSGVNVRTSGGTCDYVLCSEVVVGADTSEGAGVLDLEATYDSVTHRVFYFDGKYQVFRGLHISPIVSKTFTLRFENAPNRYTRERLAVDFGGRQLAFKVATVDGTNLVWSDIMLTVIGTGKKLRFLEVVDEPLFGKPVISGTTEEFHKLTVDVDGIDDPNGLDGVDWEYQWLHNGSEISGETGTMYTLTSADVGSRISVKVDFFDDDGYSNTVTSDSTETIAVYQGPSLVGTLAREVDENDFDNDFKKIGVSTIRDANTVTAVLQDDHDGKFSIRKNHSEHCVKRGVGAFGHQRCLRYESKVDLYIEAPPLNYEEQSEYTLTVALSDDSGITRNFDITIKVNDVDEPGAVIADRVRNLKVGHTITSFVIDTEGGVKDVSWQWSRVRGQNYGLDCDENDAWGEINGVTNSSYTVDADDKDWRLCVRAKYTDALGHKGTVYDYVSSIKGADTGWVDGDVWINNGRTRATIPDGDNPVEAGDVLSADTGGLGAANGRSAGYWYRWTIRGFTGTVVHKWTFVGTEAPHEDVAHMGDASTFTVPDGAAGMAVVLDIAWFDSAGKHMTSGYTLPIKP